MASDKIVTLADADFETQALSGQTPFLVDFWAEWCGPCRMLAPVLEKLAGEYDGKIRFGKLNVDENRQTAAKYGIRSIPTMIIFKNGQIHDQIVGALPEDKLRQRLDAAL